MRTTPRTVINVWYSKGEPYLKTDKVVEVGAGVSAAAVPSVAVCEGTEIVSPSRVVAWLIGLGIILPPGVSSGTVIVAVSGHSTHKGVSWSNSGMPPMRIGVVSTTAVVGASVHGTYDS